MSFKRFLFLTLVTVMAALALSGCKKAKDKDAAASADVLIIGGQNPETGPMADYGSKITVKNYTSMNSMVDF